MKIVIILLYITIFIQLPIRVGFCNPASLFLVRFEVLTDYQN
jgi:hypothetical protein